MVRKFAAFILASTLLINGSSVAFAKDFKFSNQIFNRYHEDVKRFSPYFNENIDTYIIENKTTKTLDTSSRDLYDIEKRAIIRGWMLPQPILYKIGEVKDKHVTQYLLRTSINIPQRVFEGEDSKNVGNKEGLEHIRFDITLIEGQKVSHPGNSLSILSPIETSLTTNDKGEIESPKPFTGPSDWVLKPNTIIQAGSSLNTKDLPYTELRTDKNGDIIAPAGFKKPASWVLKPDIVIPAGTIFDFDLLPYNGTLKVDNAGNIELPHGLSNPGHWKLKPNTLIPAGTIIDIKDFPKERLETDNSGNIIFTKPDSWSLKPNTIIPKGTKIEFDKIFVTGLRTNNEGAVISPAGFIPPQDWVVKRNTEIPPGTVIYSEGLPDKDLKTDNNGKIIDIPGIEKPASWILPTTAKTIIPTGSVINTTKVAIRSRKEFVPPFHWILKPNTRIPQGSRIDTSKLPGGVLREDLTVNNRDTTPKGFKKPQDWVLLENTFIPANTVINTDDILPKAPTLAEDFNTAPGKKVIIITNLKNAIIPPDTLSKTYESDTDSLPILPDVNRVKVVDIIEPANEFNKYTQKNTDSFQTTLKASPSLFSANIGELSLQGTNSSDESVEYQRPKLSTFGEKTFNAHFNLDATKVRQQVQPAFIPELLSQLLIFPKYRTREIPIVPQSLPVTLIIEAASDISSIQVQETGFYYDKRTFKDRSTTFTTNYQLDLPKKAVTIDDYTKIPATFVDKEDKPEKIKFTEGKIKIDYNQLNPLQQNDVKDQINKYIVK